MVDFLRLTNWCCLCQEPGGGWLRLLRGITACCESAEHSVRASAVVYQMVFLLSQSRRLTNDA